MFHHLKSSQSNWNKIRIINDRKSVNNLPVISISCVGVGGPPSPVVIPDEAPAIDVLTVWLFKLLPLGPKWWIFPSTVFKLPYVEFDTDELIVDDVIDGTVDDETLFTLFPWWGWWWFNSGDIPWLCAWDRLYNGEFKAFSLKFNINVSELFFFFFYIKCGFVCVCLTRFAMVLKYLLGGKYYVRIKNYVL